MKRETEEETRRESKKGGRGQERRKAGGGVQHGEKGLDMRRSLNKKREVKVQKTVM